MAIDTRDKRGSCLGLVGSYRLIFPGADTVVDVGDRQQLGFSYRGILAQAPPVVEEISGGHFWGRPRLIKKKRVWKKVGLERLDEAISQSVPRGTLSGEAAKSLSREAAETLAREIAGPLPAESVARRIKAVAPIVLPIGLAADESVVLPTGAKMTSLLGRSRVILEDDDTFEDILKIVELLDL